MTKTENNVFNDLFSVLFTACLSALVISCCEYFLIAVKPKTIVLLLIHHKDDNVHIYYLPFSFQVISVCKFL